MKIKYKKSDFKKISWEEYGKVLGKLYRKVNVFLLRNKIKIDAVVPILRGGMLAGMYFTYKLKTLKIIPVQYKYIYTGKDKFNLVKIIPFHKNYFKISKKPTFLLIENNHCFGGTSIRVAKDLREKFPNCKVIYAAVFMDYSNQKNDVFDVSFYGQFTNETRGMDKKDVKKKKISNKLNLFPWENLEEEMAMVNIKLFQYK